MRAAALVLAAAAASSAGCVSGHACAGRIPEDIRADAILLAIEKGLVPTDKLPQEDLSLALGAGRSYKVLSDERLAAIYAPAAGYASCILERYKP